MAVANFARISEILESKSFFTDRIVLGMRGKKKEVPCCEICTLEDDEHAEDRMLQCSLCKVTVHAGCYSAEEPASRKEWCEPNAFYSL